MTKDLRAHPRIEIKVDIVLNYLENSPQTTTTANVSDGGLFILLDNPENYPLGELVNLHYQNPMKNNTPTEKDAVIVRTENNGIAVAFIEMGAF